MAASAWLSRRQAVFGQMGYASWAGLSAAETKLKAAPIRALIQDTWARLKRARIRIELAATGWLLLAAWLAAGWPVTGWLLSGGLPFLAGC